MPYHPEIIPYSKNTTVAEIMSVENHIIVFRTLQGNVYKFNFDTAVNKWNRDFLKRIFEPDVFATLAVNNGRFGFFDKSITPHISPDGTIEGTNGFNLWWTIDDCMHLMQKITD